MNAPATLMVSLQVEDGAAAIRFYRAAFGAQERSRWIEPGSGKIGCAELVMAGHCLAVTECAPVLAEADPGSAQPRGSASRVVLWLEVADLERSLARALALGARQLAPVTATMRASGLCCPIVDPAGHVWMLFAPTRLA